MFAEQMNAWERHQNKSWWQGSGGRGFFKQASNQKEQVARGHLPGTESRGP